MTATRLELTRTVLGVLAIFTLIAASFWILRPFIAATIWSTMVVVSTWPVMLLIQERLGGRRWLAVTVMVLALLLVFFVPLSLAILTIVDNAGLIVDWFNRLADMEVPAPPHWVAGLPFVGERIVALWHDLIAGGPGALYGKFAGYLNPAARWFASEVGGFGVMTLQFLLTVVISGIMYSTGESAAAGLHAFARRLAGDHGENVLLLGAQAIRGVALGVVVTALVQSTLGGIGLFIAGVPLAALLTAVMVMTTLAQLGPILVLAPAVGWLFWTGDTVWGIALLVWTLFVGTLDNFLRPWLIKKGADLPLLLIFAGVIGGLLAFGLVGIFVGPVVLAVTYTLLKAWVATSPLETSVEVAVQTPAAVPPPPAPTAPAPAAQAETAGPA